MLFNAHHDRIDFKLPQGAGWRTEVDTFFDTGDPPEDRVVPGDAYPLEGRSLVVLRQTEPNAAR